MCPNGLGWPTLLPLVALIYVLFSGRTPYLAAFYGITACILGLGLHLIGRDNWAIYAGSWTEWGGSDDTEIATGA